jgi:hypothetical protein
MKKYIFRWKDGVCVDPSRRATKDEVWEFAIKWLRPSGISDKEAEKNVRALGEVVIDK